MTETEQEEIVEPAFCRKNQTTQEYPQFMKSIRSKGAGTHTVRTSF
jgi:hypothetical protein